MKTPKVVFKYSIEVILHLIFWGVVYFFYTYFLGYGSNNTNYVNRFSAFLMPITIGISYFFLYFLIPNYLLKRKHVLFLLYSAYTFIISVFLIVLSILYGLVFLIELNSNDASPLTKTLPFIVLGVYFVVLIVVSFSLIMHNYNSIVKNESLNSKILNAQLKIKEQELHYLKKQIHPHFLFNTLNTIYGFALKQSKETPEIILKLSNLLDYILYQVNKPSVSLKEEILHINEYISLEEIRFQDTLKISFHADFISEELQIAPLLLIPFVENAFKHGSLINGFLTIEIDVELQENQLEFSIRNTFSDNDKSKSKDGIGLENIQKRLNLLYKNNHQLTIKNQNNWFEVNLKIENLNTLNNV